MKKKKRILLSIACLAVGLASASVAFTYAWTIAATNNRVDQIEIKVDSKRNLKVSLNQTDFQSGITFENTSSSLLYQPISSYPFRWLDDKNGEYRPEDALPDPVFYSAYSGVNNSRIPKEADPVDNEVCYFSKHIYFSCDDEVYITVDPDSFRLTPKDSKNLRMAEQIAEKTKFESQEEKEAFIKQKKSQLDTIVDSIRISLLYQDASGTIQYRIIDPKKRENENTEFLGILNSSTTPYYDTFFENSTEYETLYGYIQEGGKIIQGAGVEDLLDYYSPPLLEDTLQNTDVNHPVSNKEESNSFSSYSKEGTRHLNLEEYKKKYTPVKEESYTLEEIRPKEVTRESPIMIPVSRNDGKDGYRPSEVVISVYMEGWDRDCINETMGATFDCTMEFMIARESGK